MFNDAMVSRDQDDEIIYSGTNVTTENKDYERKQGLQ